jgi:3-oxoacyl-[acyl-carrier protein] reductase
LSSSRGRLPATLLTRHDAAATIVVDGLDVKHYIRSVLVVDQTSRAATFDGRVALVTGGAHGIGRAIAECLAREGANVVIADTDAPAATLAADEIARDGGGAVVAVACDISIKGDVERAVGACREAFGRLDILAANAATADVVGLLEISEDAWRRMIEVNLTGAFFSIQEAARVMADGGGGSIVVVASTNSFWVEANTAHYSATKFGVIGLIKTAALDLAPYRIRVNAVSPGIVDTRLAAHLIHDPVQGPEYLSRVPLGRFCDPSEIARAVAFLASDAASYITGENLVVDGGVSIGVPLAAPLEPLPGAVR